MANRNVIVAYIKVVAVKKLVVGFLADAGRSLLKRSAALASLSYF